MRTTISSILVLAFAVGLVACAANAQSMLSGRVYEGQTGVESPPLGDADPVAGVTVNLYGADDISLMGTDIWGTSDQFHFVCEEVSGDVQITATVHSLEHTHEWAKAGLMIRQTLEPDSPYVMITVTPGRGVAFQSREAPGEITHLIHGGLAAYLEAPITLRLMRTGNTVIGYYRSNETWVEQGRTVVGYYPDFPYSRVKS